ncbi:hypothetical protein N7537_010200 [Penicillium hordei]|uniref:Uncharacterized protein n=1 Tax=Penicillium hordei TaxID=40994 RepID=A0AAD6GVG6_9EURO|nr:uncharacterized protein N7537_010200 [Penicillium hordei]KAJ5593296.1 hypothetical protein N7537_010200 [Penicillium hordei]
MHYQKSEQKHQNTKKQREKRQPDLSFSASTRSWNTKNHDRLIFHNFNLSYRYFLILGSSAVSFCFSH